MTATLTPQVDVRRADERLKTRLGWLDSKHSFSFSRHYDPANTHHGLLLVNNDDIVKPGTGFETHPHQDMEIVTWVLQGSLVHQDSEGHTGVIYPGLAQRMSAGTGILHSEKNDSWRLAGPGQERRRASRPGALRADVGRAGRARHRSRLRAAGDRPRAALRRPGDRRLRHAGTRRRRRHQDQEPVRRAARGPATARPERAAARGALPAPVRPARPRHAGRGRRLEPGDAARFTATGGQRVTADEPAEVLVWEMHATLG